MVSGAKQAWSRFWGRLGRLWWEGMCAHARHALRDEVEALERVKCTAARGGGRASIRWTARGAAAFFIDGNGQ